MRRTIVIVAAILAVGIPGGAIAASKITSRDIKDGTIRTTDISRSAKKALRGARGPAGLQGPVGPQGAQGSQGPAGATKVTVRLGVTGSGFSVAECLAGERAVGGGGDVSGPGWLFNSRPNLAATGWAVEADDQAGNPVDVQAFVVCAAP